jgi:hypothetical protein
MSTVLFLHTVLGQLSGLLLSLMLLNPILSDCDFWVQKSVRMFSEVRDRRIDEFEARGYEA